MTYDNRNNRIDIIRGDTRILVISAINPDKTIYNMVNGDKVYLTVKKTVDHTDYVLQKIQTEFVDGKANIVIYPSDTNSLEISSYKYDVVLVIPSTPENIINTIINPSDFIILPGVTTNE